MATRKNKKEACRLEFSFESFMTSMNDAIAFARGEDVSVRITKVTPPISSSKC
jgi:hypothetical protein